MAVLSNQVTLASGTVLTRESLLTELEQLEAGGHLVLPKHHKSLSRDLLSALYEGFLAQNPDVVSVCV